MRKLLEKYKVEQLLLAACFLFFCFIVFFKLGSAPLENWDEAWYGNNIKEMVSRTQPFVLYFNKSIFWEKPPLYMWLSFPGVVLFGISEFTVRLVAALSGIALLGLVLYHSYKRFGFVPTLFAYIVLAFNNIYVWRSRTGNLDTLPTLIIFLLFLTMISQRKNRYLILGALFGILYLAKLSIVVFPFAIFVLYELLFERKQMLKNWKQYIYLVLIALGVVAIWLVPAYFLGGKQYVASFILYSDKGAASAALQNFSTDYIMFAYYSLQRRFFWVVLGGLILLVPQLRKKWEFSTFLFAVLLVVQLTFNERKNNWYLVPAMPFWSLAAAYCLERLIHWTRKIPFVKAGIAGATLVAVFLAYKTYTVNLIPMMDTFSSTREASSAKLADKLAGIDDIVVRLDHLYPTTVYYTNRKVLASPSNYDGGTGDLFISRKALTQGIQAKKYKYVVGTKDDVQNFLKENALTGYKLQTPVDGELLADFSGKSYK